MLAQGILYIIASSALILCGMRVLRHRSPRRTISVTAMSSVRQLLSPQGTPTSEQLHSRALPNERLIRAFGLTNTFVSSSAHVHSKFTHQARKLISSATLRGDWRCFSQQVIDITETHLSCYSAPLDYSTTMQQLTLKVVLHTLFDVPLAELDEQGISLIAYGINELWRLSKTKEDLPPNLLPAMNAYLHSWIPAIENPLDFLIPTFETLWRVVAVKLAYVHKDKCARRGLQQFLHEPTKTQFNSFPPDGAPSVGAIVAEVMRLHPPTKRISRAAAAPHHRCAALQRFLSLLSAPPPIIYAADIGALQRDPAIWGPTAEVFNPMRHHPDTLTEEQRGAQLGFGLGKLQCVASNWAPLAVGVICAAVLDQLEWHGLEIAEGAGIGGREGWNGWSVVKADCP